MAMAIYGNALKVLETPSKPALNPIKTGSKQVGTGETQGYS